MSCDSIIYHPYSCLLQYLSNPRKGFYCKHLLFILNFVFVLKPNDAWVQSTSKFYRHNMHLHCIYFTYKCLRVHLYRTSSFTCSIFVVHMLKIHLHLTSALAHLRSISLPHMIAWSRHLTADPTW